MWSSSGPSWMQKRYRTFKGLLYKNGCGGYILFEERIHACTLSPAPGVQDIAG